MKDVKVIADVTRAFPNTAPEVLKRVLSEVNAGEPAVAVLVHDDQMAELQMAGMNLDSYEVRAISRTTSVPDVVQEMALASAGKTPRTVVFSFRPQVLALGARLDVDAR